MVTLTLAMSFARSTRFQAGVQTTSRDDKPEMRSSAEGKPRLASYKTETSELKIAAKGPAPKTSNVPAKGSTEKPPAFNATVQKQTAVTEPRVNRKLNSADKRASTIPVIKPVSQRKPPVPITRRSSAGHGEGPHQPRAMADTSPLDPATKDAPSTVSTSATTPATSTTPTAVVPTILAVIPESAPVLTAEDIIADAEALAFDAGLDEGIISIIRDKLSVWLAGASPLKRARAFRKVVELLRVDPFNVVPLADALRAGVVAGRNGRPRGLVNLGCACFLNAGIQALVSSDTALMALASAVVEQPVGTVTVQRGFMAAVASLASSAGPVFPVHVFLSWFFPVMLEGKHWCVNDALGEVLSVAGPSVGSVWVSTAGLVRSVRVETLLNKPGATALFDSVELLGCLVVNVNPFYSGPVSFASVLFQNTMDFRGAKWELKAVVFWNPLSRNVTKYQGHYWTVAKRAGVWWKFDDSRVERVTGPEVFVNMERVLVTTLIYDRVL